ncbi:hypothetical protein [Colwellia sp.]|nr:hypothetical protein [Colwellia sp.]
MRILDLYIGRSTHNSAATTFVTLALFRGVCMNGEIKLIEQVKGN